MTIAISTDDEDEEDVNDSPAADESDSGGKRHGSSSDDNGGVPMVVGMWSERNQWTKAEDEASHARGRSSEKTAQAIADKAAHSLDGLKF